MNSWAALLNHFAFEDRATIEAVLTFARARLRIDEVAQLARVRPEELADVVVAMSGDNPFTNADDAARLALAKRIIAVARDLAPASVPAPAPAARAKAGSAVVSGAVVALDGSPLAGALVRAFDKDLRREQLLGEATTDARGHYEITYTPEKARPEGVAGVDLLVRAFEPRGKDLRAAAESEIRFRAKPREVVNLVAGPPGSSDFERLVATMSPALDGVSLAELTEADATFLEGETGLPAPRIVDVTMAARMAAHTGLPAEAFFAFRRQRTGDTAMASNAFWTGAESHGVAQADAARFRFLAQAGDVVRHETVLVASLDALRQSGGIMSALELALWTADEWEALLARHRGVLATAGELRRESRRAFPLDVIARLTVSGRVTTQAGVPAAGVLVQAIHRDFDSTVLLTGTRPAGTDGEFSLVVDPALAGDGSLHVQLVVSGADGKEAGRSEVRYHASLPLTLDVTLPADAGPSEFEIISQRVRAATNGASLATLDRADAVEWLAGATGVPAESLRRFLAAHRQASETGKPAHAHYTLADAPSAPPLKERARAPLPRPRAGGPVVDLLKSAGASDDAIERAARTFMRPQRNAKRADRAADDAALSGLPTAARPILARALRLAAVVGPDQSLVRGLLDEIGTSGDPESAVAALAQRTASDWKKWLGARAKRGDSELTTAAGSLRDAFERAYPTRALVPQLARTPELASARAFLEGHAEFDLRGPGLRLHPDSGRLITAFTRTERRRRSEDEQTKAGRKLERDLESLQRLGRVAAANEVPLLVDAGYRSARSIAAVPRHRFVTHLVAAAARQAGPARSTDEVRERAAKIHARATQHASRALAVTTALSPQYFALSPVTVPGLWNPQVTAKLLPANAGPMYSTPGDGVTAGHRAHLAALFGSLDACRIETCQSVLGLAAYFVDLLELLGGERVATDPKAILFARRPDLAQIELSCANAETPLPYIDLVNELLEGQVAASDPRQTTWTAAELAAHPEHVNAAAYDALRTAVFPWTVPFSLPHAEADVYLGELGTSRREIMETLRQKPSTGWPLSRRLEMACASLGITPTARNAILGFAPAEVWKLWGYAAEPANWPSSEGENLRALLDRTGLEYAEFAGILDTDYVNPGRAVVIRSNPNGDACDVSEMSLTAVSEGVLSRFQGFARVWRHTRWAVRDVDRAVETFTAGQLTDDCLVRIADAGRVAARLDRPVEDVLTLWGDLDTGSVFDRTQSPPVRLPSQYERIFQNRTAVSAAERERFGLPFAVTATLAGVGASACAVLGLSSHDYARLTEGAGAPVSLAGAPVSGLSALYRWRLLATASKHSIADLVLLATLTAIDPFESPDSTLAFLDAVASIDTGALSLEELDFLFRHQATPERTRELCASGWSLAKSVAAFVKTLPVSREDTIRALQYVIGQTPPPLQFLQVRPRAIKVMEVIEGTGLCERANGDCEEAVALSDGRTLTRADVRQRLEFIAAAAGQPADDLTTALTVGKTPTSEPSPVRSAVILASPQILAALGEAVLARELARTFTISRRAAVELLRTVRSTAADDAELAAYTLARVLRDTPAFASAAAFEASAAWEPFVRLARSAWLIGRLRLSGDEVTLPASVKQRPFGIWPFNALPAAAVATPPVVDGKPLFHYWSELTDLLALRQRAAADGLSFWSVRKDAIDNSTDTRGAWSIVARKLAGLPLDALLPDGGTVLRVNTPPDVAPPSTWRRFLAAVDLASGLGTPLTELEPWVADVVAPATAAQIRLAAAGTRGDQWGVIGPRLRRGLRERQRAALTSYVRWLRGFATTDDLGADLLVDVEIGAEPMTTRLGLAVASVQRFVQRTLLGSEPDGNGQPIALRAPEVPGASLTAEEFVSDFERIWSWMKSYRTWRENRKIFLYPESYLRPELRDDKTPFFQEFEQQLSQRALSAATIEDAIATYLQKLDDVARLDVTGTCVEVVGPGRKYLHIVARTRGVPRQHYHRTWDFHTEQFSPWRILDVDIDGEWVMPAILDERLHLFWIKYAKQLEGMKDTLGLIPTRPFPLTPHYPIYQDQYTLSWSVRRRKGWTPKRTAERLIARPFFPFAGAHFAVRQAGTGLRIGGVTLVPPPPPLPPTPDVKKGNQKTFASQKGFGETIGGAIGGDKGAEAGKWVDDRASDAKDGNLPGGIEVRDAADDLAVFKFDPVDLLAITQPLEDILTALNEADTGVKARLGSVVTELGKVVNAISGELGTVTWSIKQALEDLRLKIQAIADSVTPPPNADSLWEMINQIRTTADDVADIIRAIQPIDTLPARAGLKVLELSQQVITAIGGAFLQMLWSQPFAAIQGGQLVNEDALLKTFLEMIGERPFGWAGPLLGVEFGIFDVGAAGARGLRLTPPPYVPGASLGLGLTLAAAAPEQALADLLTFEAVGFGGTMAGGGAYGMAVGTPVLTEITTRPLAVSALGAAAVTADAGGLLGYSLFPGYPGFFDVPVLNDVFATDLPLHGMGPRNLMIQGWPGSGYFLLAPPPPQTFLQVAVNLARIAEEEARSLLTTDGDLNDILAGDVRKALDATVGLADKATDAGTAMTEIAQDPGSWASRLNVTMKVVRPLPFGEFPGRLYNPPPTIVSEDRHGRSFLLIPDAKTTLGDRGSPIEVIADVSWNVRSLYHPLTGTLCRALERDGVAGVYASASAPDGIAWKHSRAAFEESFIVPERPTIDPESFTTDEATENLDLTSTGAYSQYNWELFYHLPMLIGARLAADYQFEQAIWWYRRVFDPTVTAGAAPQRYWRFKKFYDDYGGGAAPSATLTRWLSDLETAADSNDRARDIAAWQRQPFNPHLVARHRTGAYERAAVMRTIEAFIAWGDSRFKEGTWESINEATQLYLIARDILGPRPRLVPARPARSMTYETLRSAANGDEGLDPFGNALLAVEGSLPALPDDAENDVDPILMIVSGTSMLYFGVPPNERLLAYWDLIDDRLYKIRQNLDIKGKGRPAFAPGLDLDGGTSRGVSPYDTPAAAVEVLPLPPYRFGWMVQKANEFAGDVKALGSLLLGIVEKRDAEQLARVRADQELSLLRAVERVRLLQMEEATASLAATRQAKDGAQLRYDYYTGLEFISIAEAVKEALFVVSSGLQIASGSGELAASLLHAMPEITVGAGGHGNTPNASIAYGSNQVGNAASAVARAFSLMASVAQTGSAMAGTIATYERRQEEWDQQARLADNDLQQCASQIEAAELRLTMARRELENHQKQVANAGEISTLMREKFTNQELYDWMLGQVSAVYLQSYLLAVDLARKAEACYRFERASDEARFVTMEQWDSLATGLLAGERLQRDLRQMEAAFIETHTREFELTKHVSLVQHDPVALLNLQQTGRCFVDLPERLFDADHAGHYLRRVRTVSLTIPCVTGPYTTVNCRLTLVRSRVRVDAAPPDQPAAYYEASTSTTLDSRFRNYSAAVAAIATSSGQNDSGMFELNLRDERYLPFEGAGAIGVWQIELPKETNQFDFTTMTDVVLHLRYTAREGSPRFREMAMAATFGDGADRAKTRLFSARRDFPDAWHRFLQSPPGRTGASLDVDLSEGRFPYRHDDAVPVIGTIDVACVAREDEANGLQATLSPILPDGTPGTEADGNVVFEPDGNVGNLPANRYTPAAGSGPGPWRLRVVTPIEPSRFDDILLLCTYTT